MAEIKLVKFNENAYLAVNADVRRNVELGKHASALEHFLRHGIDENRAPVLRREPINLRGHVEFFFVSDSGFFVVGGWLADEGCGPLRCKLAGADFSLEISPTEVCRFARKDVEGMVGSGAYDYGFFILGSSSSKTLLKQNLQIVCETPVGAFETRMSPQIVSNERLLNFSLVRLKEQDSHEGQEYNLYRFLTHAGDNLVEMFRAQLKEKTKAPYVESFGRRPVSRSFITVLFGSTEAIKLQPMLFRSAGVDFGEWIYVCNSPEDGEAALRLGRAMSELYDVPITVVVLADNVGFGAANNIGVEAAQSQNIYVVNPDVFPLRSGLANLRRALARPSLGDSLWGGLLFYDDQNLMHSGMYMEHDVFVHRSTLARHDDSGNPVAKLVRVEHFDKCVPFDPALWTQPRATPAISGAVMAFDRKHFERIGGFSSRYIFGHYEDADLSLRWRKEIGPVVIDPDLQLMHLEGQGSRSRGDQYRAAQIVNRYLFSLKYNDEFARDPGMMTGDARAANSNTATSDAEPAPNAGSEPELESAPAEAAAVLAEAAAAGIE